MREFLLFLRYAVFGWMIAAIVAALLLVMANRAGIHFGLWAAAIGYGFGMVGFIAGMFYGLTKE